MVINMIDWEKSAALNVCNVEQLKERFVRFPKSAKKVVRCCDECGNEEHIYFYAVRDLCNKCSKSTIEFREKAKIRGIKQFDTQSSRDDHSILLKHYYNDHPETIEAHRLRGVERCSDQTFITEMSKRSIKQWASQEARDAQSVLMIQYLSNDKIRKRMSDHGTKRFSDSNERKKASKRTKQWFKNHPESGERHSATMQGQDYDAGEWSGYTSKKRHHVLPKSECIQINNWFTGSHAHHITKSIIAFIPAELHNHVRHNLKTGSNMGEMNALAIQFINGGLET